MKKLSVIFLSIMATVAPAARAQAIKMNSALEDIISPDAKLEKLADASGRGTLEGPVWVRKGGYLLFSDMGAKVINKWSPADGKVSLLLDKTGADGVALDPQGRIVWAAEHEIIRQEMDGQRTVLASKFEGSRLNRPNDLIYKSNGTLYFTDPSAGLGHSFPGMRDDPTKEIPFNGVYLLKDGQLRLATKDISWPNGLVFSPDEKYLYISDTFAKTIAQFDVRPDDSITNGKVIAKIESDLPHIPDGMKVDQKGNIYGNGPGGLWIMSPEGRLLGIVLTPDPPANVAFGEADGKTLFLASRTGLYRIRLKVSGIRN